ncbi:hypothetical protein S245_040507, partial [Arachis hypogaea]
VCKEERVPLSTEVSQMQDIGLIRLHSIWLTNKHEDNMGPVSSITKKGHLVLNVSAMALAFSEEG